MDPPIYQWDSAEASRIQTDLPHLKNKPSFWSHIRITTNDPSHHRFGRPPLGQGKGFYHLRRILPFGNENSSKFWRPIFWTTDGTWMERWRTIDPFPPSHGRPPFGQRRDLCHQNNPLSRSSHLAMRFLLNLLNFKFGINLKL